MIIKQINWLGQEEAIVTISDGEFEITAFAHLFGGNIDDELIEPLFCLSCNEIKRADKAEFKVIKPSTGFEQYFYGEVIDIKSNIVKVGKIKIELDNDLPKDINNGDFISFSCGRVDVLG